MAITTSAVTTYNNAAAGASHTVSYTVSAGSNQVLVVRAGARRGALNTTTQTATYNGVSMTSGVTQVKDDASTNTYRVNIFYLANPASGTHDFVVTGNVSLLYAGAIQVLDGVDLVNLPGVNNTDTGTDAQSDVALTSMTADSYSVGIHVSSSSGAPTWTWTNVSEDFDFNGASGIAVSGAYYANASASSVTFTGTRSASAAYCAAALEFKADATGQPMVARARQVPGMRRRHGHQGW